MMTNLKLLTSFLCSWLISTSLISHDYKTVKASSKDNNIISLDLIDESTFDIHWQTQCKECECFVDLSPSTNQLISEKTFKNKAISSFMDSEDTLYILHQSDSNNDYYYSIYKTSSSEIKEITKEAPINTFKGNQNVKFSSSLKAFFAHDSNSIIVNSFSNANQLKNHKYSLNRNDDNPIYDIAFIKDTLYLAKGALGLETISINNNQGSQHLSIQDLELKDGSSITRLSVNHTHHILYAFSEKVADSSFFLALDATDPNDLSILNNYQKEVYNIVKVVQTEHEIHVINNIGEKYYYTQFSLTKNDNFANIDLNKVWEIPFKVNDMSINGDKLLIHGDDYLYIFKNNLPYETQAPELLLEIVKKTGNAGDFYPFIQKGTTYFVNVDSNGLKTFAVNQNQNQPSFNCGSFSPNYQGEFTFNIFVFKNSCPELGKNNKDDICLYRYTYDVTLTGNNYEPLKPRLYAPTYIENSFWDSNIDGIASKENPHKHSENKTSYGKGDQNTGKPITTDPTHHPKNFDVRMKYIFIVSGLIIIAIFACLLKCFCGESKEEDEFEDDEHPHIHHKKLDETDQYDNSEDVEDVEEDDEAEQGEGEEYEQEEEEEKQNDSDNEAQYD